VTLEPLRARQQCRATLAGLALLALASGAFPPVARASSLIVPDQAPTIQAAIDAAVETVLVRPGVYPETLQVGGRIALLGIPETSQARPTIAGMNIYDDYWGQPLRFQRLQFDGPITAYSYPSSIDIGFVECDLRGGITDRRTYLGSISTFSLFKCFLNGPLSLPGAYNVSIDSCQVLGSVLASAEDHVMTVTGCTFQGGGVHSDHYSSTCRVEGNTIRGGGFGIYAGGNDAVVKNNIVEDAVYEGVTVGDDGPVTVVNNVIRRCGSGISASGEQVVVSDNLVEDCQAYGLVADYGSMTVVNNVIRRCARGILVSAEQASVTGNTVIQAHEGLLVTHALQVDVIGNVFWMCVADGMKMGSNGTARVRQNTSCYNGLSGFASVATLPGQEWVGNIGYGNQEYGIDWQSAAGATIACNDWFVNRKGAWKGQALAAGDITLDPEFCDVAGADLHLSADSPLLDWQSCGRIGALGAGCGPVGVVADATPAAFALTRVGPIPTRGPMALELTLPRAAAIEVTVHDVQGRTVARLAGGEWSAGRHPIEWNGEGTRGRVPPGLYLIRYRYPGGEASRRIVIAR